MTMYDTFDPVIDEDAQAALELEPCPYCDRKFSKLSRHVKVCKKLSKKSRPVFDSSKQRLSGISEQDKCLVKPVSPSHSRTEQKDASPPQHPPQERIWNRTKSYVMGLKDKFIHPKVKPRANSLTVQSEPPRAKSETTVAGRVPENYVQCPSCDRWFGPKAADRHIEWCTSKLFRLPMGNGPSPTEKKRWESRVTYKAPLPGKSRLENRQKYGFGPTQMRLARGFSPPKIEQPVFERSGPRRTSLRGRRFGESEDPMAYALGRQESPPPRKQPIRRFLSSSAYRAEPDGIDHAVLSKSSKADGYEIHRSLLHENAARQLEELLMSSSTCSLGELSLPGSMSLSMPMSAASSSLLMSTSLGADSRHFSPSKEYGLGKSRIPMRRSPSPHMIPMGPTSVPSDEFLLNELMASDLLSPPSIKSSSRKQACPPPSLQEMLYGGVQTNSSGEKGRGGGSGSGSDDDNNKPSAMDDGPPQPLSPASTSTSTSGKASVVESAPGGFSSSSAQLVARHEKSKRESADGRTASSATSSSLFGASSAAVSSLTSAKNSFGGYNSGGSFGGGGPNLPSSTSAAASSSSSSFTASSTPHAAKPAAEGVERRGSGRPGGFRADDSKIYPVQAASTSAAAAAKASGLSVAPKSRTQDLFNSSLFSFSSSARMSKMTSVESDDDVITASHNVVTNIASEMGSLSLFDTSSSSSSSSRLRPSAAGSGDPPRSPNPIQTQTPTPSPSSPFATSTSNVPAQGPASPPKFCHECGSKYPVNSAKFCCNCGARRVC